mmetsp:Transcript_70238/g.199158  ORF Transcript_70238/g.199158 Transcript_70238/m.199158 type:complete len:301 (+) Transcript_70238:1115-2017(+)
MTGLQGPALALRSPSQTLEGWRRGPRPSPLQRGRGDMAAAVSAGHKRSAGEPCRCCHQRRHPSFLTSRPRRFRRGLPAGRARGAGMPSLPTRLSSRPVAALPREASTRCPPRHPPSLQDRTCPQHLTSTPCRLPWHQITLPQLTRQLPTCMATVTMQSRDMELMRDGRTGTLLSTPIRASTPAPGRTARSGSGQSSPAPRPSSRRRAPRIPGCPRRRRARHEVPGSVPVPRARTATASSSRAPTRISACARARASASASASAQGRRRASRGRAARRPRRARRAAPARAAVAERIGGARGP